MKTFRMIGMALVAVMLGFAMSSCDNDDDEVNPYKDYPQLIVGKWFNFTPEASMFFEYKADNTFNIVGFDKALGHWSQISGTYRLEGNKKIDSYTKDDGSQAEISTFVEIKDNQLVCSNLSNLPEAEKKVNPKLRLTDLYNKLEKDKTILVEYFSGIEKIV